jgi:hypothetical protein
VNEKEMKLSKEVYEKWKDVLDINKLDLTPTLGHKDRKTIPINICGCHKK